MVVILQVNGGSYSYPELDDSGWGIIATAWAAAISTATLQKVGGTFTLTAEVDFGANYGLKSLYFKSRTVDTATSGQIRLAREDTISFRNTANNQNLALAVNGTDRLTWNGVILEVGGALTGTDGITIISGSNFTTIQGFRPEFVAASGFLQSQITGGSVTSVNSLTGAVTLAEGSNITITPVGNTLTIASTAAGGAGSTPNALVGAGGTTVVSGTDRTIISSQTDKAIVSDSALLVVTTGTNTVTLSPDTTPLFTSVTATTITGTTGMFGAALSAGSFATDGFAVFRGGTGGVGTSETINGTVRDHRIFVHSDGSDFSVGGHSAAGSQAAGFRMYKSSGTHTAPTAVTSGTALGVTAAYGHDGTDYGQSGRIRVLAKKTATNDSTPGTIYFDTASEGSATNTTRVSIDDDGVNLHKHDLYEVQDIRSETGAFTHGLTVSGVPVATKFLPNPLRFLVVSNSRPGGVTNAGMWPNMPAALNFLNEDSSTVFTTDTTGYTKVSWTNTLTQDAGSAGSALGLRYKSGDFSFTPADYTTAVGLNLSLATTPLRNTSNKVALPANAIGTTHWAVCGSGGNGAADPSIGAVVVEFWY